MKTHLTQLVGAMLPTLFLWTITCVAQDANTTAEVLTNENVVTMVRVGLVPSVVVNKIRTSKTNFRLNTIDLVLLQQASVPAEIINAMVESTTAMSTTTSRSGAGDSARTDPNDPLSAHDAGIYLYQELAGKKTMTQLEPSVSKQTKTGGVFASALTYGIAKVKFKAALAGQSAPLQIDNPRPVFYFYFEVKNSGLSSNSGYATSPNEFVLVRFNTKSATREITVSQANAFGAQSGAMDKAARAFKVEKIGSGVYRVTPQEDLTEGEYGFYNGAGAGPSGGAKIFDFGIRVPR